jgi:hypothetical protein
LLKLGSAKHQGLANEAMSGVPRNENAYGRDFIGGPKFVRKSVNERPVLNIVFLSFKFYKMPILCCTAR